MIREDKTKYKNTAAEREEILKKIKPRSFSPASDKRYFRAFFLDAWFHLDPLSNDSCSLEKSLYYLGSIADCVASDIHQLVLQSSDDTSELAAVAGSINEGLFQFIKVVQQISEDPVTRPDSDDWVFPLIHKPEVGISHFMVLGVFHKKKQAMLFNRGPGQPGPDQLRVWSFKDLNKFDESNIRWFGSKGTMNDWMGDFKKQLIDFEWKEEQSCVTPFPPQLGPTCQMRSTLAILPELLNGDLISCVETLLRITALKEWVFSNVVIGINAPFYDKKQLVENLFVPELVRSIEKCNGVEREILDLVMNQFRADFKRFQKTPPNCQPSESIIHPLNYRKQPLPQNEMDGGGNTLWIGFSQEKSFEDRWVYTLSTIRKTFHPIIAVMMKKLLDEMRVKTQDELEETYHNLESGRYPGWDDLLDPLESGHLGLDYSQYGDTFRQFTAAMMRAYYHLVWFLYVKKTQDPEEEQSKDIFPRLHFYWMYSKKFSQFGEERGPLHFPFSWRLFNQRGVKELMESVLAWEQKLHNFFPNSEEDVPWLHTLLKREKLIMSSDHIGICKEHPNSFALLNSPRNRTNEFRPNKLIPRELFDPLLTTFGLIDHPYVDGPPQPRYNLTEYVSLPGNELLNKYPPNLEPPSNANTVSLSNNDRYPFNPWRGLVNGLNIEPKGFDDMVIRFTNIIIHQKALLIHSLMGEGVESQDVCRYICFMFVEHLDHPKVKVGLKRALKLQSLCNTLHTELNKAITEKNKKLYALYWNMIADLCERTPGYVCLIEQDNYMNYLESSIALSLTSKDDVQARIRWLIGLTLVTDDEQIKQGMDAFVSRDLSTLTSPAAIEVAMSASMPDLLIPKRKLWYQGLFFGFFIKDNEFCTPISVDVEHDFPARLWLKAIEIMDVVLIYVLVLDAIVQKVIQMPILRYAALFFISIGAPIYRHVVRLAFWVRKNKPPQYRSQFIAGERATTIRFDQEKFATTEFKPEMYPSLFPNRDKIQYDKKGSDVLWFKYDTHQFFYKDGVLSIETDRETYELQTSKKGNFRFDPALGYTLWRHKTEQKGLIRFNTTGQFFNSHICYVGPDLEPFYKNEGPLSEALTSTADICLTTSQSAVIKNMTFFMDPHFVGTVHFNGTERVICQTKKHLQEKTILSPFDSWKDDGVCGDTARDLVFWEKFVPQEGGSLKKRKTTEYFSIVNLDLYFYRKNRSYRWESKNFSGWSLVGHSVYPYFWRGIRGDYALLLEQDEKWTPEKEWLFLVPYPDKKRYEVFVCDNDGPKDIDPKWIVFLCYLLDKNRHSIEQNLVARHFALKSLNRFTQYTFFLDPTQKTMLDGLLKVPLMEEEMVDHDRITVCIRAMIQNLINPFSRAYSESNLPVGLRAAPNTFLDVSGLQMMQSICAQKSGDKSLFASSLSKIRPEISRFESEDESFAATVECWKKCLQKRVEEKGDYLKDFDTQNCEANLTHELTLLKDGLCDHEKRLEHIFCRFSSHVEAVEKKDAFGWKDPQFLHYLLLKSPKTSTDFLAISDDEQQKLKPMVVYWLIMKTEIHHVKRCLDALKKNLYTVLLEQRHYDPQDPKNIPLLLMEYFKGFFLRKKQVDLYQDIALEENTDEKVVLAEAVMGVGKTTLIPAIIAYWLYSAPERPCMIILPEQIIRSQFNEINKEMRQIFGIRVERLCRFFDTDSGIVNVHALENALNCSTVIMATSTEIQQVQMAKTNRPLSPTDTSEKGVTLLLNNTWRILIDECDDVLGWNKKLVEGFGTEKNIDSDWVAFVVNKIRTLHTNGLLKAILPDKPVPFGAVLPELASSSVTEALLKIRKDLDVDSRTKKLLDLLDWAVKKVSGFHFGSALNHHAVVIPYKEGKPCTELQFSSEDERLILSIFHVYQYGFTEKQLTFYLQDLVEEYTVAKEISLDPIWLQKTQLYKMFGYDAEQIVDQGVLDGITRAYSEKDGSWIPRVDKMMVHMFERDIATFLRLAIVHSIDLCTRVPRQPTCFKGFTGTLNDNEKLNFLFSAKKDSSREKVIAILSLLGTKFRNMDDFHDKEKIKQHFKGNVLIDLQKFVGSKDCHQYIERFLHDSPDFDYALYFVGEVPFLLKKVDGTSIFQPLKTTTEKELKDMGVENFEKLFVLFDTPHARGIDVPLHPKSKAWVLVGKHCTLDQLLQGICRLRMLSSDIPDLQGHSVEILLSQEMLADLGYKSINDIDMIGFCVQLLNRDKKNDAANALQVGYQVVRYLFREWLLGCEWFAQNSQRFHEKGASDESSLLSFFSEEMNQELSFSELNIKVQSWHDFCNTCLSGKDEDSHGLFSNKQRLDIIFRQAQSIIKNLKTDTVLSLTEGMCEHTHTTHQNQNEQQSNALSINDFPMLNTGDSFFSLPPKVYWAGGSQVDLSLRVTADWDIRSEPNTSVPSCYAYVIVDGSKPKKELVLAHTHESIGNKIELNDYDALKKEDFSDKLIFQAWVLGGCFDSLIDKITDPTVHLEDSENLKHLIGDTLVKNYQNNNYYKEKFKKAFEFREELDRVAVGSSQRGVGRGYCS